MISSSPTCIPLDSGQVDAIASGEGKRRKYFVTLISISLSLSPSLLSPSLPPSLLPVLEDSSKSSVEKCEHLKSINVFGRLRGYIYHELFTKVYCPQFHNSPQVKLTHNLKFVVD